MHYLFFSVYISDLSCHKDALFLNCLHFLVSKLKPCILKALSCFPSSGPDIHISLSSIDDFFLSMCLSNEEHNWVNM